MLSTAAILNVIKDPEHTDWDTVTTEENISQICDYILACDGTYGKPTYEEAFQFLFDSALFTDAFAPYVILTEWKSIEEKHPDNPYWSTHSRPVAHLLGEEKDGNAKPPMSPAERRGYVNGLLIHYAKLGYISQTLPMSWTEKFTR